MLALRLPTRLTAVSALIFSLATGAADVDGALQREVVRQLSDHPQLDIVELEVRVDDGIANLSGQVARSAEKHLASRYANDVPGVQGVVNLIEVVPGLRQLEPEKD